MRCIFINKTIIFIKLPFLKVVGMLVFLKDYMLNYSKNFVAQENPLSTLTLSRALLSLILPRYFSWIPIVRYF